MKKIIVVVLIVLILGICKYFGVNQTKKQEYLVSENKTENAETIKENDIQDKSMVFILNGVIQNENLIDDFIEKAIYTNTETLELNILQDYSKIKVVYNPGEYASYMKENKVEENTNFNIGDGSVQTLKKIYGYYSLIVNGETKGEYALNAHTIKRFCNENIVTLYFDAILIDYAVIPAICTYNLETSNYKKDFEISFNQRKDLGIKTIADNGDYKIKSFGGDVDIVIENDMAYKLEDALSKNVITVDDILAQAQMDSKYGIAQEGYYHDGGSREYRYPEYTIIKLNTLEGEKDLVIGYKDSMLKDYNKAK